MKHRKPTTLVVTLALVVALVAAMSLAGCNPTPTPPPAPEYTISFAGGDGATGDAPASLKKKEGEKVTLPANPFSKEEHNFTGWSDGTTSYAAGDEYTVQTKDVTFTAQWSAIEYTVGYTALGEGVTGSVPATANKKKGDKVTLAAAPSKTGSIFVGWSDGSDVYAAGAEYTVNGATTFTAEWLGTTIYAALTPCTVDIDEGKFTVHVKEDYGTGIYDTVFDFSISGSVVTFTKDSATYTGTYKNGIISVVLTVKKNNYVTGAAPFLFSDTVLTLVDGGINGYIQSWDFESNLYFYLFDNGVVACTDSEYVNYQLVYTVKVGTYTRQGDIVTVSFPDESSFEMKLTVASGNPTFYDLADGLKGDYKQGTATITLDGFNGAKIGQEAGVYGVMGNMIYLENTDQGTVNIYTFDKTAKTIGTSDITANVTYVYFGAYGSNKFYFDGSNVGYIYDDEGGKTHYDTLAISEAGRKISDDMIMIDGIEIDYSDYSGICHKAVNAVAAGNYVDNLDSTVTAVVAGDKLTISKGSDSVEYTVAVKDCVLSLTATDNSKRSGYVVNGVIYANVTIGGSSQTVALTSSALTTVGGGVNGYVVNSGNADEHIYLFSNNVAVMVNGASAQLGGYVADGSSYSAQFAGETAVVFNVTEGTYVLADIFAGTYELDSGASITLDGYGNWTSGGQSGKYFGFSFNEYSNIVYVLNSDGSGTFYSWSAWNGLTEPYSGVLEKKSAGTDFFKAAYGSYNGGVVIYEEGGVIKGVKVKANDVLTIDGVEYTATSVGSSQIRLTYTNLEGNSAVVRFEAAGGLG